MRRSLTVATRRTVTGRGETTGSLLGLVSKMSTPGLVPFGDADRSISVEDVERLKTELLRWPRSAAAWSALRRLGTGTTAMPRGSYTEEAAVDGWQRTLEWFDGRLGQPTKP
jgi:carboxymethylenebutenolidase